MARRLADVAVVLALAAAAFVSALLVPPVAARLGLDSASSDVQFAVFLGLWGPAVVAAAVAWLRAGGVVGGGALAYLGALLSWELVAGSALISSWATLAVLSAFAAAGWWLMGRLGWRSPASPAALLADLLEELRGLFGNELVGVYLYGSAVAGDFDPGRSDLDLVVVCGGEVEGRLAELEALHRDLVGAHPEWDDRVDVLYVPAAALREFRERSLPMAVISPGEPLHLTQTSPKWMMNWHLVREQGKALLGPPAASLIPATTPEDFVASVRAHLERWPEWIGASDRPAFRAYAVLTLCRALHALHLGRQASKREAARWAVREYPEWSELIGRALAWLDDESADVPDPTPFLAFVRRDGGKLAS